MKMLSLMLAHPSIGPSDELLPCFLQVSLNDLLQCFALCCKLSCMMDPPLNIGRVALYIILVVDANANLLIMQMMISVYSDWMLEDEFSCMCTTLNVSQQMRRRYFPEYITILHIIFRFFLFFTFCLYIISSSSVCHLPCRTSLPLVLFLISYLEDQDEFSFVNDSFVFLESNLIAQLCIMCQVQSIRHQIRLR